MYRSSRWSKPCIGLVLVVVLAGFLLALPAHAHLIFFKDGFVLHGKLVQESTFIVDPSDKQVHRVSKGVFFVDDGARRHFFPQLQVQDVDKTFFRPEETLSSERKVILPIVYRPQPVHQILDLGTFDQKWDRVMTYRCPTHTVAVRQHLQELNTFSVRVTSTKDFLWNACYLTQELGVHQVLQLLRDHKDLRDAPELPPADRVARRLRIVRFLVMAGWLAEAQTEWDRVAKEFPEQKTVLDESQDLLRRTRTQRTLDDLSRARRAGQHQWVAQHLPTVDEKSLPEKSREELRSVQTAYTTSSARLNEAREALSSLIAQTEKDEQKFFTEVAETINLEVQRDSVARLETFVSQAQRADRQTKAGRKPDLKPTELLSLAATSWLLGNAAAEPRMESAQKLWRARQFVLTYLRSDDERERERLLREYATQREALAIDELAQMLSLLPPARAEAEPPTALTEIQVDKVRYLLQLPPEYTHARAYPVLLVLGDISEQTREMMGRWSELAGKEGYILACPEWARGVSAEYSYTVEEHTAVLQTLGDLRRRFNVDSDRVFLFGLGEGGTMAFDVGLSHPDLFAGVLPMSGNPEYFCQRYWPNAQYLPFYVVGGDYSGEPNKNIRLLFEKWVTHAYPAIYVQYKGRGREWFGGELPSMFDWMNRKKRHPPVAQLGRIGVDVMGDEFCTMRPTDNRFYWVTAENIQSGCFNRVPGWSPRVSPATLTARLDPAGNQIFLYPRGIRQLTVWLARDAKLDFDKPIKVWVNGAIHVANTRVQPSLATLLEDYHTRGDRQRLYIAKYELKVSP